RPQKRALVHRHIRVKYAIAGQVVGFGIRTVAVVATARVLPHTVPRQRSTASRSAPADVPAWDLSRTIRLDESDRGRLEWTVARWVPGSGADPQPAAVPPDQAPAKTMAVIRGQYPDGGVYGPLYQSAEEARELIASYAATPIEAGTLAEVLAKLGQPIGEILHFACHGNFQPT